MSRSVRLLAVALWSVMGATLCLPVTGAAARQSMSFRPGDRMRVSVQAAPKRLARRSRHANRVAARPVRHRGVGTAEDDGPAAQAVPGAGFTMEDGVLTYPAPARFQPQNLKHH